MKRAFRFPLPWLQCCHAALLFGVLALLAGERLCQDVAVAAETPPLFEVTLDHEFPEAQAAFDELRALIRSDYYTEIDEMSLFWAAAQGMLRHISPPENKTLAKIWAPAEYERVAQSLRGVQESIGIKSKFNPADGALTIVEVLPGGPSVSLLEPYDRILRVAGTPLRGLGVAEVEELLRGEEGTRVSLKVVRDVLVFDLVVTRAKVKLANVEMQEFPGAVVYLAIRSFSVGVSQALEEQLALLRDREVAGILLDLRENAGGVFGEALKAAELFVRKDASLMRMVSHGSKINNYVSANEDPFPFPVVLLVNGNSASGSEILAAALRDAAGAALVGAPTYGKGSMEKIYTLANEYRVKFTYAALYSPKGVSWQKTGLRPDFAIEQDPEILRQTRRLTPELRLLNDAQLRAAYRLLTARDDQGVSR